jgi:hypothetical protein
MTLSERDKRVVLILPAILVVAGYGWFCFAGKHAESTRLEKSLEEARLRVPTREQLQAQQRHLTLLQRDIAGQQKELEAARQKWLAAAGQCAVSALRNERIEKLTSLLHRHGLSLIEDGEAGTARDKEAKAPTALEPLAQQMGQISGQSPPQLRRIRLQGRYGDMLRALQALGQGEVLAIPVAVTMKAAAEGVDQREWTLLVWI